MFQCFETILLVDGELKNISAHQDRVDRTCYELSQKTLGVDLVAYFRDVELPCNGKYRIRFEYGARVLSHAIERYIPKITRTVGLVHDDNINYQYKYKDRSILDHYSKRYDKLDEIIIIKNNKVTDSITANICFYNETDWVTPATYLLRGTMREKLLKEGVIKEREISVQDIKTEYTKLVFINALRGMDTENAIPTANIIERI